MFKVMIDAGHGGIESGAIGLAMEKDINLEVALILKNKLNSINEIEAELTRYQDTKISLSARCDLSDLYNADLFISIHHNASNGSATGYEIYHHTYSEKGKKIAHNISVYFDKLNQKRFVGSGMMAGSKKGDYYVLRETRCPAVLTEFCFIDNVEDLKKYNPETEADAIFRGVCDYFGIVIEQKTEELNTEMVNTIKELKLGIDRLYKMIRNA